MRTLATVVTTLVVLAAAAALYVVSGNYNVAATDPDRDPLRWTLSTITGNSIRTRAKELSLPELSDSELIRKAGRHYHDSCAACHGAPGVGPSPIVTGLNPPPPTLLEHLEGRSDEELFWIVKHGIKMTGMPAFRPSYSDQQVAALVAFVRKLPDMSAEEYRAVAGSGEAGLMTRSPGSSSASGSPDKGRKNATDR